MNYDITFCSYSGCPFKDCERHLNNIKENRPLNRQYIRVSDFSGICRRYIGYVVDEVCKEETK